MGLLQGVVIFFITVDVNSDVNFAGTVVHEVVHVCGLSFDAEDLTQDSYLRNWSSVNLELGVLFLGFQQLLHGEGNQRLSIPL